MSREQLAVNNEQKKDRKDITNIRLIIFLLFLYGLILNITAQEVAVFPQMGNAYQVDSVAFSPDGKQILSSSFIHMRLWDTDTGREIRTFISESFIISVAFSPDGRQAICGRASNKNNIVLWNVITGQKIRTFEGHTKDVLSVVFSPDGKQILSGSNDYTMKLWDTESGLEIRTFKMEGLRPGWLSGVCSVAFSPDGKQVLSGLQDGMRLWDVESGNEIKSFSGHTGCVYSVAFSPDGKQIVSGCENGIIKLWDIETGNEIRTFTGHTNRLSLAFSLDGKYLLSGSYDETIKLWDVATGREIKSFSGHTGDVRSVAFSPDGKQVITGSSDRTIKLWDIASGREVRTFTGYTSQINSVAYSHDGKMVISGSSDYTIKLWDIVNGREKRRFYGHTGEVSLSGSFNLGGVHSVSFDHNSRHILSGASDKTVRLWDTDSGREIRNFSGHTGSVFSVAFSPDGRQVLSGSRDNTIKLWNVATGREIRNFSGHTDSVFSVAFNPDSSQILSGSSDKTIKLWETESGLEIKTFSGHTASVSSVTFSPDGKSFISGSWDCTIKLWDVSSGEEIISFSGHTATVSSVAFSPDGKKIISSSYDGSVRIWDISNGSLLKYSLAEDIVTSAAISPDGEYAIAGTPNGVVLLMAFDKSMPDFYSFADGEWICITPDDGYYNASPNGDKYLNVRVGNNVYGIDQYRNTFYNPQIVEARLQGRPDPVQVTKTIQDAASFKPPVVIIRSPETGTKLSLNQVELSVSIVDQNQPIKEIKVYVNSKPIGGDALRGISGIRGDLEATGIRLSQNQNRIDFRLPLTLDPGNNLIEVIASNPYSQAPDRVEVFYNQAADKKNILPNLWILSIGINRYDDSRLTDLNFAVNDAREIINVFKAQEGKVYNKVNSLLIADGEKITPTVEHIRDNFKYLKNAGHDDIVMLFIAGHGQNDDGGNFYFMPSDAAFGEDNEIRPSRAISNEEIRRVLDLPGRKLVFIDACHSEGVTGRKTRGTNNEQLVNSLKDNSTVVLTSSMGNQLSQEILELRHGVFTYAIIQGMKGAADLFNSGSITMDELKTYVSRKVPELAGGLQHPTSYIPPGYVNYKVADFK